MMLADLKILEDAMKSRLTLVSVSMLVALLFSFVPLAGSSVQSAAAATYCDAIQFLDDGIVKDGTFFAPGAAFKKTWRLKNIGTCTWSTAYSLVYASGEKMGTVTAVVLPSTVAPGQIVDVSVDLTAPASAGKYRSNWQLANASGVKFGIGSTAKGVFWVEIVVSSGGGTAGVVYNFADKACDATWTNGAKDTLPCPGTDGDAKGFVLKQANPRLENGVADTSAGLLVSPQAVYNGYIQGAYPAFRVQNGDQFQATVSCEYGAISCYVSYRLDYQIVNGSAGTLWPTAPKTAFQEKYEGQYFRAKVDLSRFSGQDVKFILYTDAYGSPTGDRALWGNPIILRQGATITPVPTTPSPNSGCDKAQFVSGAETPTDGITFAPGTTFKKTWRLKNIGTCIWTTDYFFVFSSGEKMGGPSSAPFPTSVAPGQTMDLSVNLTAPNAGGTFTGYWGLKNASGQVFGINTGSHQPFFWVTIKVTGPTATPGTITPTVTPGTTTPQAGTALDFVADMCKATWVSGATSGKPPLPCPGKDGDTNGFVLKIDNPQLENGAIDPRPGLLTNPQNTTNGYIQGIYPAFRVQQGDRFQSIINCQYGATSCYVVFRLDYQIGDATPKTFWTFGEKYEGQYYQADKDLSSLAGQDVKFILSVMAGTYATGDRALWVAPRIYRAGAASSVPVPAATTAVPPAASATATVATPTGTDTTSWSIFQNAKYKFQFKYPPGATITDQSDVSGRIDLPITAGTRLSSKYVDVSVTEGANPCKNTISGGAPTVTSGNVTINGITFLKETGGDVAAGNLYEWEAYSAVRPNTNACVSVAFVLRSQNAGSDPSAPPAFDKAAESAVFQIIMSTFAWAP
jgi:hypothetical protein